MPIYIRIAKMRFRFVQIFIFHFLSLRPVCQIISINLTNCIYIQLKKEKKKTLCISKMVCNSVANYINESVGFVNVMASILHAPKQTFNSMVFFHLFNFLLYIDYAVRVPNCMFPLRTNYGLHKTFVI